MRNKILPEQIAFINYINKCILTDSILADEYCEKLTQINTQAQYNELASDKKYTHVLKYGDIEFEFSYYRCNEGVFLVLFDDEIDEYLEEAVDDLIDNIIEKLPKTLKSHLVARNLIDLKAIDRAEILAPYDKTEVVHTYKDTTIHIFRIN